MDVSDSSVALRKAGGGVRCKRQSVRDHEGVRVVVAREASWLGSSSGGSSVLVSRRSTDQSEVRMVVGVVADGLWWLSYFLL